MTNALALFDLDHTITTKDTFIDFVKYSVGSMRFAWGIFLLSPFLALYALGLVSRSAAKEHVISFFFKGWNYDLFREYALRYSSDKITYILKPDIMNRLSWHKSRGHRIAIVTASLEDYLEGWCDSIGVELIGTKIEVLSSRITGHLLTKNCYGAEKVARIMERYDLSKFDAVYAYGDNKKDKEMLALATTA
jgi:HAD superfamily hydrolase (TIGR01490 family)